ncbi:hypothetical protein KIN20_014132 [Parelaphostrongylus tenuis]|uniref:Uncharacterized protein n=1 Tax=Parelaphostrongylus tenuis TaxID=148309 RepID=A0AAD5MEI8_PARTN|nr:hypothetical protein KIN20_014132 [Parelaphostrongylus tenuis]
MLYKLFTKIILLSMLKTFDEAQSVKQPGSRKRLCRMNNIQVASRVIEVCRDYRILLVIIFVGYETPATASKHFASNATGQLDVLGHDRHAFRMDSAEIGILERSDQVGLGRHLQNHYRRRLETSANFEISYNLLHKTFEWQLADQQLG